MDSVVVVVRSIGSRIAKVVLQSNTLAARVKRTGTRPICLNENIEVIIMLLVFRIGYML